MVSQEQTISSQQTAAAVGRRRISLRRRLRESGLALMIHLILIPMAVLFLLPLAWMLSTSLKDASGVFAFPPQWIPDLIRWENYGLAMSVLPFGRFFMNTSIITFTAMFGQLLSCSLVAFAFARLRWSGRHVLFIIVLSTMMLPNQVTLIPTFLLFRQLGWLDTFLPMIVPAFFGGGPFLIFLMRQFFMTLPTELDDAARIDGCNTFGIYWRIILPLAKPVMIAAAIFSFESHWNDFFRPLIYLQSREKFTLSLGLHAFNSDYGRGTDWHLLMAASLVVMLPVILVFFIAQRYFIQGVVFSGVKG
ncbi:carbohydrate ABC transporter permease [Litorilinea aerophila]|uniref:Carbohydrate ABC transporter permease n=1 Tax=Litorilinea aerophila TaxID=1204385 RepID=A0A540VEV8_9CHLR|nr:carbohydrate ABC transporter permease [Litorilinea aerophila]MCC9077055.1 carbohydrate ABC transporter permease [Litorilinea aerophila]